jgi:hypothetical protein
MKLLNRSFPMFAVLAICASTCWAKTTTPTYTIFTLKNGQQIGKRIVHVAELRDAATALIAAFQERTPDYSLLVSVAKGMNAKDRCFNLYSSRTALASVQGGIQDASANSEEFLNNSIRSIEEVNNQTQVTCDMK